MAIVRIVHPSNIVAAEPSDRLHLTERLIIASRKPQLLYACSIAPLDPSPSEAGISIRQTGCGGLPILAARQPFSLDGTGDFLALGVKMPTGLRSISPGWKWLQDAYATCGPAIYLLL